MNNRQRGILLRLVGADKPLTSEQLAGEFKVSSRTIKTDMAALSRELEQNGARLQLGDFGPASSAENVYHGPFPGEYDRCRR